MSDPATHPAELLRGIAAAGLLRKLQPLESPAGMRVTRDGAMLWNFASNDYLGLASHPQVIDALADGARRFGVGSTASRLICGTQPPHVALEEQLAQAKQSEAALVFSSGSATAMGTIPAVVGKGDFVLLDRLSHACLIDAAKLSGATLRVFPHNDTRRLAAMLSSIRAKSTSAHILIVTESVFSMDGDLCPLREIADVADEYDAWLLVDEAHAFGVIGASGMGLAERENLQQRITFQMGTLGKAAGVAGGYLAASRDWIDLIINRARTFIYSTAMPPALAHAALVAVEILRSSEGDRLRAMLHANVARVGQAPAAIVPMILGRNEAAMRAAEMLAREGFLVPAIRYPTVPRNTARLRISLCATHPSTQVDALKVALDRLSMMAE
jgi:8-amino-7-oxononanoate synthase